jgi:hypothetical protein
MDYHGRRESYGIATPGYAPPVPYGMSQVNIEGRGSGRPLPPQPTVKVYSRANPNYAMAIRNGKVVLAPANPKDDYQARTTTVLISFSSIILFLTQEVT